MQLPESGDRLPRSDLHLRFWHKKLHIYTRPLNSAYTRQLDFYTEIFADTNLRAIHPARAGSVLWIVCCRTDVGRTAQEEIVFTLTMIVGAIVIGIAYAFLDA